MAEALGVTSSVIAVVDLSAKVFSLCLQYSREVKNARKDIERLREEVATFQATTKKLQILIEGPHGNELSTSKQLLSAIEDGRLRLEKLEQQLQLSTGQKTMRRFGLRAFRWPFDSKDVKGTIGDLERSRGHISSALNIDQTAILQKVDYRNALDMLSVVHEASFDSHAEEHNSMCLPNTREELLHDIDCWIDDATSKTVYWLNGMAGTGKSTIARTVAHLRSKKGDLGASFFFKRGEIDRSNLNKLMSTLAHQLAISMPRVASFIRQALDDNPAVVGKSVREQFQSLIQEPLSKAAPTATTPSSIVIVIDALDECDHEADIRSLIGILSQAKNIRHHLRVFLTSRPELPIRLGFSEIQGSYQDLVLHKIPAGIVEHDIIVFLNNEFDQIRRDFNLTVCNERKLPSDWPGRPTVQGLAQMAAPLFIFAATICRFIGDRKSDSPPIQLRKVLDYERKGHVFQLDLIYGPILRSLITNVSKDDRGHIIKEFKMIIGCIVILGNPLSVLALSQLLEIDPEVVDNRLDTLHSVLRIPSTRKAPVHLLHLSFRDYLITHAREFRVDERYTHETLTEHCIRVMRSGLRENICGLPFPGARRYTVDGSELEKYIPPQLQYACMHWAYHQIKGDPKLKHSTKVHDFLKTYFLYWVEAMSLLGRVKECLDTLRLLARWLEEKDSSLSALLTDALRFLQAYISVVAEAPLQIYSCLAFAPRESIVRKMFENSIPRWINKLPKVQESWDASLLTFEGHSDWVSSVVFSPDSKKLASGSGDKTIQIWDAETGECKQVLEGHSGPVNSVVFSHDSKKLASASWDKTIRIWDTDTGDCQRVLEGHSNYVISAAFSHNSEKLASASWDKTIRIWDTDTGDCQRVLGHSDYVISAAFSHNSKKLASGSRDEIIRIWDTETGKCEKLLKDHNRSVNSVVFSWDSKKLASASNDKTIRIWDTKIGHCEDVLSLDHYAGVLYFTPDEHSIVTNRGTFALTGGLQSSTESAVAWQYSKGAVLICIGDTWVSTAGKDFLWLPPECRNGKVAVSGNKVVIGCRSGRVLVLGIFMADLEQRMDM